MNKSNKILLVVFSFIVVCVIGYALFSENITVTGTATAQGTFDTTVTCQTGILSKLGNSYILKNPNLLFKDQKSELINIIQKLDLLNPLNILSRGYSITYSNDKLIKDIKDVKETVDIKLYNGFIKAKVIEVKEN